MTGGKQMVPGVLRYPGYLGIHRKEGNYSVESAGMALINEGGGAIL